MYICPFSRNSLFLHNMINAWNMQRKLHITVDAWKADSFTLCVCVCALVSLYLCIYVSKEVFAGQISLIFKKKTNLLQHSISKWVSFAYAALILILKASL